MLLTPLLCCRSYSSQLANKPLPPHRSITVVAALLLLLLLPNSKLLPNGDSSSIYPTSPVPKPERFRHLLLLYPNHTPIACDKTIPKSQILGSPYSHTMISYLPIYNQSKPEFEFRPPHAPPGSRYHIISYSSRRDVA